MHQSDRYKGLPKSTEAARAGFETIKEHLLAFNAQRGWTIDIFFHTWDSEIEEELVSIYHPVAHGVSGQGGLISGYGLPASVENVLTVMGQHSGGNTEYQRVVAMRFDTMLLRAFELDKLDEEDTLYAASWCKASGRLVVNSTEGKDFRVCLELTHNPNDLFSPDGRHGLPDFYFGGSPATLQKVFHGLHAWMLSVPLFNSSYSNAAVTGGSWAGGAHFIVGERVALLHGSLKLRRYLQHHMDIDMVREGSCGGSKGDRSRLTCDVWMQRSNEDVGGRDGKSYCDRGEVYCACNQQQLAQCSAFN